MDDGHEECRQLLLDLPASAATLLGRYTDGTWVRPALSDWEASKVKHSLTGIEEVSVVEPSFSYRMLYSYPRWTTCWTWSRQLWR